MATSPEGLSLEQGIAKIVAPRLQIFAGHWVNNSSFFNVKDWEEVLKEEIARAASPELADDLAEQFEIGCAHIKRTFPRPTSATISSRLTRH